MNRTLLFLALVAISATAVAQKAPLPPPEARPAGLPPAPVGQLPTQLPGNSAPIPGQVTPPAPGVELTPAAPAFKFDMDTYQQGLLAETQRMDQAIGHQMRVVLVQEGSQEQQMAISVAKQERQGGFDPAAQREIGPGGILATGQYAGVGGPHTQVCVIVSDPERAGQAWDTFIAPPVKAGSHPQTGFAWMVAHAAAHCLDAQDRANRLRGKLAWRPNEISALGLWPDAVRAALQGNFGGMIAKDGLMNNAERIYNHGAQRQYSERVADAFATMWITRLGATQAGIQSLAQVRLDSTGDDAGIRAASSGRAAARAGQSARADRLWDMAREVQVQLGVDSSLVNTNTPAAMGYGNTGTPENEVVQWVVTAQGVVGVDGQGRIVRKPTTTEQVAPGRNFKDLKRFGQGM